VIVTPRTNLYKAHAPQVLAQMAALLRKRRRLKISRTAFLVAWSVARRMLERTPEYQAFRQAVLVRDRFLCKSCHRPAHTVHHRRPVVRFLSLALCPSNGEVKCHECHALIHPHLRKAGEMVNLAATA